MATIESPYELLVHKLGAALTMEETTLEMLERLHEEASGSKLQRQLQRHHEETKQQIQNLRRAFEALGEEPDSKPSPTIEGIEQEGEQMIKQVDAALVDSVILDGLIETKHHEIAVYDGLIITAETTGEEDLVPLFQENLEQETHALDEAVRAAEQLSYQLAQRTF